MRAFFVAVFGVLDRSAKVRFGLFSIGSTVIALIEAMALFLVVPLIQLLTTEGSEIPATGRWVTWFLDDPSRDRTAVVLAAALFGTFIVKGVAALALLHWGTGNALRQEARVSRRLFNGYLRAPYVFHLERNSSDLQRTLNESMITVFRRTLPFALAGVADVISLGAIAAVMFINDPLLALVAGAYFVVVGTAYQRLTGGSQRRAADATHKEVAKRIRQVQQALRAVKVVTILRRQRHFVADYYRTRLELAKSQRQLAMFQLMPRYILDMAFVVGGALVAAILFATRSNEDALASVGLFLAASFRLIPPLNRVLLTATLARSAMPSIEQIVADLKLMDEIRTIVDDDREPLGPSRIELRSVSYRYATSTADVLKDISLTIEPGESIGIVGGSGAGKSTLLDVILGLLQPTSGEVSVGGVPMTECLSPWQRSIGYVPQEIVLIDESLRANVAFGIGDDEIDDQRIADVLVMTHLSEAVLQMPDGTASRVGENGVRLSGGQRQRLGIARALYSNPSVLVFDEATSALDNQTEALIVDTIAEFRRTLTTITVAHRLSTVRDCDRIYFMAHGRIAAVGNFSELQAAVPDFARLVELADVGSS